MKKEVARHFKKVDPVMHGLAKRAGELEEIVPRPAARLFHALCGEIVAQQLSSVVARVIFKRFAALFPKGKVTPKALLGFSEETLRATGMSWAKARYLRDVADKITCKKVKLTALGALSDEEAIRELTKIKGIGRWTAEMFLMFSLGREDVFSHGDLGLRKALWKHYHAEKLSSKQVEKITAAWSPYRTWAARILWKLNDP